MKEYYDSFTRFCQYYNCFEDLTEYTVRYYSILNEENFIEKTGLSRYTFFRFRKSKGHLTIHSIFTICLVFGVHYTIILRLLEFYNRRIDYNNEIHCAYIYLAKNHSGKSIDELNQILKEIGIGKNGFLGSQ